FRNSRRVVPIRGQDPVFLVVPRKAADLRLDQLQASLVAQVRPMLLEMCLEARGPLDQSGEVLGDRKLRPLRTEDLEQAPARREPDAGDAESVAEAHADRGGGEALLVEPEDRVLDLGLFHPRPLRTKNRNSTGSRPVFGSYRDSSSRTISIPSRVRSSHVWNGAGRAADPCQNSKTKRPPGSRCDRMRWSAWRTSRCVRRYPKAPNKQRAASNLCPNRKVRMSARTNRGGFRNREAFFFAL